MRVYKQSLCNIKNYKDCDYSWEIPVCEIAYGVARVYRKGYRDKEVIHAQTREEVLAKLREKLNRQ